MSSARRFGLESKFSVRSLIYKRNNRGPRMDPLGMPTLTSTRVKCCQIKITFSLLPARK